MIGFVFPRLPPWQIVCFASIFAGKSRVWHRVKSLLVFSALLLVSSDHKSNHNWCTWWLIFTASSYKQLRTRKALAVIYGLFPSHVKWHAVQRAIDRLFKSTTAECKLSLNYSFKSDGMLSILHIFRSDTKSFFQSAAQLKNALHSRLKSGASTVISLYPNWLLFDQDGQKIICKCSVVLSLRA